jgi:carboxymethylenebutenolidase
MRSQIARIALVSLSTMALVASALLVTSCQQNSAARSKAGSMPQSQPDGHMSLPPSGKAPLGGVLVLHPWWGVNETVKNFCERLAEEGFVVFAPDLYHGKVATTIAEAEALGGAVEANVDQANREIREAAAYLRERAGNNARDGIAVIGFSMGAYFALDLSIAEPDLVNSVVAFYGSSPEGSDKFSRAKARYLVHFAETDKYEPQENVESLEQALKDAGRPATIYRYQGTGHWFFEHDRPEYDAAAASLAWERTLAFLKQR